MCLESGRSGSASFWGKLPYGDGQTDFDAWRYKSETEENKAASSSSKKPRIQIEDAEDSSGGKKSSTSQGVEHFALKISNLGQFKFPWEQKRLAGIFCDIPSVKMDPPSLQPGSSSFLSLSIQVKSKTELQPVVKADGLPIAVPAFRNIVKNVGDLSYVDEREKRRGEAICAWWDLLVTSISNGTVGCQSTVDATAETI